MKREIRRPHVLCLRFSSLGDVAIASVVLKACARDNPGVLFTLAGPGMLAPLFAGVPNLSLFPVDKKQPLRIIFRSLWKIHPTHVADLHSVIRSYFLRAAFFLHGKPVAFLHKERGSRRRLLKAPATSPALVPVYQLYAKTLQKLGFQSPSLAGNNIISLERGPWKAVGIAPFALHNGKQWPPERMRRIAVFLAQEGARVFLFGGGREEKVQMEAWVSDHSNICLAAGTGSGFEAELAVIKTLDVMISMDSANMHLPRPWAFRSYPSGSHPSQSRILRVEAGSARAVQLPMDYRLFHIGAKKCWKGTYACPEDLTTEQVLSYVRQLWNKPEIMAVMVDKPEGCCTKCGSVYFGVGELNMRAHAAHNFRRRPAGSAFCQNNGMRSYLTVNTIFTTGPEELKSLLQAAAGPVLCCNCIRYGRH